MTIFAGLNDIVWFIVLFALIYCMNDSIIAEIILGVLAFYSADIYTRLVMDSTNPDDVKFVFFFIGLGAFAIGNIAMWVIQHEEEKKAKKTRSVGVNA